MKVMTPGRVSDALNRRAERMREKCLILSFNLEEEVEDFVYFLHGAKGSHLLRGMRVEEALKHEAVTRSWNHLQKCMKGIAQRLYKIFRHCLSLAKKKKTVRFSLYL